MPLGPQFMRLFAIGPQQFGFMVSAYTFAAAASGFVAAFWIDRFDRRRALLVALRRVHRGDGALRGRPRLSVAARGANRRRHVRRHPRRPHVRDRRGSRSVRPPGDGNGRRRGRLFAGGDRRRAVVPVDRRALLVARAVPRRSPAFSVLVGLAAMRLIPPLAAHVAAGARRRPVEQLRAIFGVPNHQRAFAFMFVLMCSVFTVVPVHRRLQRRQRRSRRSGSGGDLFRRRRDVARDGAGDRPARRSLRQGARVHDPRVDLDRTDPRHHAPAAAAARLGGGAVGAVLRVRARPVRPRDRAGHRQRRARGCAAVS